MFSQIAKLRFVCLLLPLLLGLAADGVCQEEVSLSELRKELDSVKAKVGKEKERLAKVEEKSKEIEGELKKVKQDLLEATQHKRNLEESIGRINKEQEVLEISVEDLGKRVVVLKSRAAQRIKAAYFMQRRMAVIDYLVSATSVLDVQKRSRYLVHIAQHDRSQMLSLAKAFKDLAAKKTELVRLKVEKESSLQEIEDITASLEKKRFAQGTLLGNLKTQKKQREMAVERYQASAKKLESLLSDLMGKRIVKRAPKPKTTPQVKETSSTEIVQPTPTLKPEVYPKGRKMHGLRGFRGRLPLPVQGTVIRKYGAQHHADFSDVFFVKGLEFSVQAGSEIKAVAYGRVIFAETVPEYGNVVIVNHGKRFYTLYGRLNEIVPLVGDIVEGGDVLARTGKKDRWGRNFYFELRYKGKAIDPWRYFANSPPYQPR